MLSSLQSFRFHSLSSNERQRDGAVLNASNKRLSSERTGGGDRRSVGRGRRHFLNRHCQISPLLNYSLVPLRPFRRRQRWQHHFTVRPMMVFRMQIYGRVGGRDAHGQRQIILLKILAA